MTNHEAADILRNIDCCANLADIKGAESAISAAISALRAQEKEPKWISVKDRLPKEGLNVLIYIPFRGAHLHYVSYMESGLWYVPTAYGRCSFDDVTHWMPLPDPPTSMTIQN